MMPFKISCLSELDRFNCCYCYCSLRTAVLFLGWLELILGVIQLSLYSAYLLKFEEIGRLLSVDSKELIITIISEAAVLMLCCMLLLFGAHLKKPGFMIPYLMVCLLGMGTLCFIVAVAGYRLLFFRYFITGLLVILSGCTLLAVAFYLWLVVYSYYRKLLQPNLRSRRQKEEIPLERLPPEQEPLT